MGDRIQDDRAYDRRAKRTVSCQQRAPAAVDVDDSPDPKLNGGIAPIKHSSMYGIRMGNNHIPAVPAVSGRGERYAIGTAAWRLAYVVQRDVLRRVVCGIQTVIDNRCHRSVNIATRSS